ncbi:hypothetical protein G7Y31_06300 [Corynebacterium lizhenjunii]|uniref:YbjN domain-containing protein n=1 Tax=Corynebacterium lizhenjunii TaxID=2709394 RepID=A0A7T0KD06_9CORY|nr:hypothetical protein [Corynebacterium lizhenjunii]QPK78209.1 hypothetical protein G7Y31_06300 [Corynebacterium lizhenjunii]
MDARTAPEQPTTSKQLATAPDTPAQNGPARNGPAQQGIQPVTRERVVALLAQDDITAVEHPEADTVAVATFNQLDWAFSIFDELVKVECILPTTLSFADSAAFLRQIANEHNAAAFDGRVSVGDVDGQAELRGDAVFVASPGMTDAQLFHALNFAVVAAQELLLQTLDTFNNLAQQLTTEQG